MSSENIPESTRTVIENAEAGDLLEFNRGVYNHWAVYIGGHEVVHLTGLNRRRNQNDTRGNFFTISGIKYDTAAVRRESVWNVVRGSRVRVNNETCRGCPVRSDRDIIATALEFTKQKEAEYHFLRNNCEHFATSCRYQRAFSRQSEAANSVLSIAQAGVYLGAAVLVSTLFLIYILRNN